jgi:DNA polymerase III epsilon subunit-like protein
MPFQLQTPIYFIDFEGTSTSGIIEFGIVCIESLTITSAQTQLCAPKGPISAYDLNCHHLTESILKPYPTFDQHWTLFATLRTCGPFAAHHATTENTLLRSIWPYGPPSNDFISPNKTIYTWGPWVDTYQLYAQFFPKLTSYKLSFLVKTFKLQDALTQLALQYCPADRRTYHCALYDALASALLFLHLSTFFPDQVLHLQLILAYSASSASKRQELQQLQL